MFSLEKNIDLIKYAKELLGLDKLSHQFYDFRWGGGNEFNK